MTSSVFKQTGLVVNKPGGNETIYSMQESQEDSQLSEFNGSVGDGRQKLQLSDLKSERSNSPTYKNLLMSLPTYRYNPDGTADLAGPKNNEADFVKEELK